MCTLTLAWQVFAKTPVALAATRDEALGRESDPPALRTYGDGRDGTESWDTHEGITRDEGDRPDSVDYVAPRDRVAGGTWIGLGETGLVVAVTNRWLDVDREGDRSRGRLVADCLTSPSAEAAVRAVERDLAERAYDGFELVLADDVAAFLLSYDGGLSVTQLDPGIHVVGNVGGVVNGREAFTVPERRHDVGRERVETIRRVASALVPEPGETADGWLDRASEVFADHEYGACLHGDGFGTRSFTRIRTGDDPAFWFADGPPCKTDAEPVPLPDRFASDA
ncbi:MAG: NRDE family protein [Halorubrum sp.]